MTLVRGRGCVQDPSGHLRTPFYHLAAKMEMNPVVTPKSCYLSSIPGVMDQDQTGACTGHGFSCGIKGSVGDALPFVPSPKGLYDGRAIDRFDVSTPLSDSGAMMNQILRWANEYGVRAMQPFSDRYSDVSVVNVNDEETLTNLEEAATSLIIGGYMPSNERQQRIQDIRMAISNGKAIPVAVDSGPLQSYTSGVLRNLGTSVDHCVCIVGYDTLNDGSTIFRIRNSWSAGFGENGDFWLHEDAVMQLFDLYVLDVKVAS